MCYRCIKGGVALLAILVLMPAVSMAAGTTGATFLNIGVSARAEAMGGAYSAIGKTIEVFVMAYDEENTELNPEVWVSAYPHPWEKIKLTLRK